jgi:hypothetical protein
VTNYVADSLNHCSSCFYYFFQTCHPLVTILKDALRGGTAAGFAVLDSQIGGGGPFWSGEGECNYRIIDRKDRSKQQYDKDSQVIDLSNEGFEQPSDEDVQGNVLVMRRMDIDGKNDIKQRPNKEDAKPAVEQE